MAAGTETKQEKRKAKAVGKTEAAAPVSVAAPARRLVRFHEYPVADVLETLLADKTTGREIVFASDAYTHTGAYPDSPITNAFLSRNPARIRPRVEKDRAAQDERTRRNAEVFTPLEICRRMNDWFDRETRAAKTAKAGSPAAWQRYADARVLEITCGEAPFIVSRYDAATGAPIPVSRRVGILDRKLRLVDKQARDEAEWTKWTLRAFQSVYGYEYQGDSLLLARANLLVTFADHVKARWKRKATRNELQKVANILAWNFWQMDGLTGKTTKAPEVEQPYLPGMEPEPETTPVQGDLFGETDAAPGNGDGASVPDQLECILFDWRKRRPVRYNHIGTKGTPTMRFDFVIGNPPYQEETASESTRMPPIYDRFMDKAYTVADKVELITPARFLFNGGYTPKAWNEKMLADPHFKVLEYIQKSEEVFANTDIKGGVVITYRNDKKEFGAIGTFTVYNELNSILQKVSVHDEQSLMSIMSPALNFKLSPLMKEENPNSLDRLRTSGFVNLKEIFFEEKPADKAEYVQLIGLIGNKRTYRWVRRDYLIDGYGILDKYKVILPNSNGSGAIGEVLSTPLIGEPLIGEPLIGYMQSFIAIGAFDTREPAEAVLKYVKTKFARTMLGILKVTQHNPPDKWLYVPLQDFTSESDIDWTGTVAEVDAQLYRKYGLSEEEIRFIEEKVKAME